ncbi:MAG TPA: hypothetical protein VG078_12410, partial [Acidimicrobiales bacterium]|nr:hypothetical protein [Acidimicrobiales bacterium]
MTSIVAHGGTAGLAAEIFLLSLPVLGFHHHSAPNPRTGSESRKISAARPAVPPWATIEVM